jgi:probable rRNA maturation factor
MEINILIEAGLEESLKLNWLQRMAKLVLTSQNADPKIELGLVITNQERIKQLNRNYLGKDEPTDVLAFSMLPTPLITGKSEPYSSFAQPPDGVLHLGEVIISYPQAVIQSEEQGHSTNREIAILIIHGILHLMGYDHDEPELERQMTAKTEEILRGIEGKLD